MDTTLRPDPTTPVLTVDDVAHLGTTVCVFAHPDDETYLAGGLMAALRRAGRRVVCVTATRGEAGAGGSDRPALARTRTAELAACLGVLGVTEHEWLGYADQECSRADPDEAATAVQAVLDRVRPDTVVAFGPDGFTGHPDHRAVAAWTQRAVEACRPRPRLLQPVLTAADLAAGRDLADAYDVYAEGLPRICRDDELAARLVLAGPLLDRKVAAAGARQPDRGPGRGDRDPALHRLGPGRELRRPCTPGHEPRSDPYPRGPRSGTVMATRPWRCSWWMPQTWRAVRVRRCPSRSASISSGRCA